MVKAISQKYISINVGMDGLGWEYSGDNYLLKSVFPTVKFTSIESSIAQLYEWYLTQKDNLDKNSLLLDK